MSMEFFLNAVMLLMLLLTAIAIIRSKDLFSAVMLGGIYSFITASIFMILDAVDVAFTEAAVGAGISTVLFLCTLSLVGSDTKQATPLNPGALIACGLCAALLIYATKDMPAFGDPDAPIHQHVAPRYLEQSIEEVGPPNFVTSVLASYRGYDTLGEVGVVFSAAIGVILLLGTGNVRGKSKPSKKQDENTEL